MGQSIAKSQNAKRLMDDRQQEIITQSTIFFKPFSDENGAIVGGGVISQI